MAKFSAGDRIMAVRATHGWGFIKKGDLGEIVDVGEGLYVAKFPRQPDWHGWEECFELHVEQLEND